MSATAGGSSAPPNWYPDPADARLLRYWDGEQWTAHTAPSGPSSQIPSGNARPTWQVIGGIAAAIGIFLVIIYLMWAPATLNHALTAEASDTAARNDVLTLGRDLQAYYRTYQGAPPTINATGGNYHVVVDDQPFRVEPISPGVAFGGLTGEGESDWCVWVSAAEGKVKTWQFSAQGNLAPGDC